jgi:hypothetical protein
VSENPNLLKLNRLGFGTPVAFLSQCTQKIKRIELERVLIKGDSEMKKLLTVVIVSMCSLTSVVALAGKHHPKKHHTHKHHGKKHKAEAMGAEATAPTTGSAMEGAPAAAPAEATH